MTHTSRQPRLAGAIVARDLRLQLLGIHPNQRFTVHPGCFFVWEVPLPALAPLVSQVGWVMACAQTAVALAGSPAALIPPSHAARVPGLQSLTPTRASHRAGLATIRVHIGAMIARGPRYCDATGNSCAPKAQLLDPREIVVPHVPYHVYIPGQYEPYLTQRVFNRGVPRDHCLGVPSNVAADPDGEWAVSSFTAAARQSPADFPCGALADWLNTARQRQKQREPSWLHEWEGRKCTPFHHASDLCHREDRVVMAGTGSCSASTYEVFLHTLRRVYNGELVSTAASPPAVWASPSSLISCHS